MPKLVDLTNQKFGRLIAIKRDGKTKLGAIKWLCLCDCGNNTIIVGSQLRNGRTKSCGCLRGAIPLPKGQASFNALFGAKQKNAKRRGYDFQLSKDFFKKLTSGPCFYCGSSPSNVTGRPDYNGDYVYNGIDRVDNNKGYVPDNVVSCCRICNEAKKDRDISTFLVWIKKVAKHNKIEL